MSDTVSDKLDEVLAGLQQWSEDEKRAYMEGGEEHPLFLTRQPEYKDLSSNAALSALANAEYDEFDTPFTLANECKAKGNESFASGPTFYSHAIRHFNESLQHIDHFYRSTGCNSSNNWTPVKKKDAGVAGELRMLEAAVYGNLAAVYLSRKKWITALQCAEKSLKIQQKNAKVLFRAAKCCLELGKAQAGVNFVDLALELDPESAALRALLSDLLRLRAQQRRGEEERAEEHRRRAVQVAAVRAAVRERHMQVGPPMFRNMRRTLAYPYVESEVVHWPVLLLYPQYSQSDWIDDVAEVAPLSDVLDYVLPETGRPAWDVRGEYVASNCDIFYVSNPCKTVELSAAWQDYVDGATSSVDALAMDAEAEIDWSTSPHFIRIPPAAPLMLPLVQPNHVTADIPVFYVVARSSDTYQEMKRRAGGAFTELRVPELPPPPPSE